MQGRMTTKNRQEVSPDRAKVWTEKSPKYHYNHRYNQPAPASAQNRKVPVVYYLCRNRQLEHPHFMEVPLSSSDGLYLRDVIERLDSLRGRGMASMYSWSCKRSFRNCLVWHDLCADDLIVPAHENEYVLKGSELFDESNSGRFSKDETIMLLNQKALPEPPSSRSRDESSSSSSLNDSRTTKNSQDDELSPPSQQLCSSAITTISPDYCIGKNSPWNGSLSLTEYKVDKSDDHADASTQTEENSGKNVGEGDTCTRGVSTDDGLPDPECDEYSRKTVKEYSEISKDFVSPPPSTSSASSCRRVNTLESLIRADARSFNSFKILEEEEFRVPTSLKLKASNVILQLLSCGSISVKDHSFGLIPTYKPRFSHSKYASPLYSTSSMMGEHDGLAENPHLTGVRMHDKKHFSGSFVEMNMLKEGVGTLKRSSSYNADRGAQQCDIHSVENKDETVSTRLKCIPISIKISSKQPRCESMRSPLSEVSRTSSSDTMESSRTITPSSSNAVSKRSMEPFLGQKQPMKLESFRHEKENVIKIEERLASGARVIIQSTASSDGK